VHWSTCQGLVRLFRVAYRKANCTHGSVMRRAKHSLCLCLAQEPKSRHKPATSLSLRASTTLCCIAVQALSKLM
jgi:hypothetical protein